MAAAISCVITAVSELSVETAVCVRVCADKPFSYFSLSFLSGIGKNTHAHPPGARHQSDIGVVVSLPLCRSSTSSSLAVFTASGPSGFREERVTRPA